MTFTGFPDAGLVFYEGLEADNTRSYWTDHRAEYEAHVRAPLQALLDEVAPEFGGDAKVFRPYRDVRFSNDKTPYKTHAGAVVHDSGSGTGAWYVQVSAEGLLVAGGSWRLESDQVERYRRAVDSDVPGGALEQEVARLRGAGFTIEGDRLVRSPRGYPADHPRIDLLRHRSLHASRHWPPAGWLHTRQAATRVRDSWREFSALNRWLADNVGATTVERSPRR
ncbi:TIGR02453 family protein [Modestobacter sp. I12A-02628]|uniref:DUF2461 domain-containing protein n=1 Tax=Goekera deserti TaxID=2497753 RepID=A0A7K3WI58_9ACTN|nr:DUF2461 domain-containing protein [Goekera deserti]MPQ96333.1 TIGR02453 family protein [Goekera deserti]NDI50501.1 TIGR02453 family protein [Goekera deserti]NEL56185.1 DUF2461 domain-containing protein [Goekera deserti]